VTRRPVVIDTNVVVAGLLTGDASSPVARILDGMLAASFPFVVSEALLAEYRAVLVRPELRRQHGLTATDVDALLTAMARHTIVLPPGAGPPAPDRGDQLLWDLLAARPDLLLVAGEETLQDDRGLRARILSPRAFVDS
jgi:predicted nucleic acid-binding protein